MVPGQLEKRKIGQRGAIAETLAGSMNRVLSLLNSLQVTLAPALDDEAEFFLGQISLPVEYPNSERRPMAMPLDPGKRHEATLVNFTEED